MKTILKFKNIKRADFDNLSPELKNAKDIRYLIIEPNGTFTESIAGQTINTGSSGGGDGGYQPDNTTIVLNEEEKLSVKPAIITQVNNNTNSINGKLDKKPDGTVDLITANNKIDARYLDIYSDLFIVVASLPSTGVANKIYLVPSSKPNTQNELDEFIWVDNAWERIGGVSVDLSNYYNKTDVDSMIDDKVDKVSDKGLSTNDFTNNDKNKLDGIEAGAEVNPYSKTQLDNILGVKQDKLVAGDNITIDENTNVISASGGEIDPNAMAYFDYASSIYGDKYSLLANAWEHSLTVDPLEISADGAYSNNRGKAQYQNGEAYGVIIPHGVTSIGEYAFQNWEANNQPLVIPNSVTSIENSAFSFWTSNNHPLVIPDSVTSIGNSAFYYWQSNTHPLVIPESVTSIGNNAFSNWTSNNQPLTIPNSVTTIGNSAFDNWQSNNHPLIISNSVTSIGELAFRDWTANNQPLVIPSSVTSIGDQAFLYWSSVPYVEIRSLTPPTLAGVAAFYGQNDAPIYVPDESVAAYKTATNWSAWADRIFPISDKPDDIDNIEEVISLLDEKQDKLVAGDNITIDPTTNVISASGGSGGGEVDLNEMTYFNFASSIYSDKYSLLVSAWKHSLTVDTLEISEDSQLLSPRGKAQYPNGKTEGVIIPHGVTTIGANAFNNVLLSNQELVLVIPNSVTTIGEYAFSSWKANNNPLVIPDSVTSIGNNAFGSWTSNNHPLVIPSSVTSIGNSAFSGWSSNTYPLVIPKSVTSIGDIAFSGWSSNNQPLVIPRSVTNIGGSAFDGWSANTHQLVIPNSVTSIGDQAFYAWSSNNQPLVIPDSVTSIGINTFRHWSSNKHPLVIPHSVTSIDMSAFRDWRSNNQPLVIPDSVTDIGQTAFDGWSSVPYVEIQAITPPTLGGSDAFDNQNDAPIYVPDESVAAYKTATNWVSLASRIFPISDKEALSFYTKTEIDSVVGDIESALDAILGV